MTVALTIYLCGTVTAGVFCFRHWDENPFSRLKWWKYLLIALGWPVFCAMVVATVIRAVMR